MFREVRPLIARWIPGIPNLAFASRAIAGKATVGSGHVNSGCQFVVLVVLALCCSLTCGAAERYTDAKIIQVELGDSQIVLFLQRQSGDQLPTGNGGTNESVNKELLFLATSTTEVVARQHFLASALVAMQSQALVRFRWDDTPPQQRILYMLVKGS